MRAVLAHYLCLTWINKSFWYVVSEWIVGIEFKQTGFPSFALSYPIFISEIGQSAKASHESESKAQLNEDISWKFIFFNDYNKRALELKRIHCLSFVWSGCLQKGSVYIIVSLAGTE